MKSTEYLLNESKYFCMMPWVHMHIWPNGNCMPCCMSDSTDIFGNINDNPMSEVINSDKYKELRTQMLNDQGPKACTRCYELEETAGTHTLRKNSLSMFGNLIHLVEDTGVDGSISDFKMRYMDIRFSNLCNMKCRTCGPDLSSSWHDDQIKLHPDYPVPKFIDVSSSPDFMSELETHLRYVEEVYFAGGEVLITPQHYEVLDFWLQNSMDYVRLRYTTNFSALNYKKKSMLNYWNMFRDVRIAASLDSFGPKAEYLRSGTHWDSIVKNRELLLEHCPNVYFEITPTISLFSIHSLFEFHRDWVDKGYLDINNIRINILTYPRHFSITILPQKMKDDLTELFKEYVDWLENNGAYEHTISSIKGIVEHMNSADNSELIPQFIKQTQIIDEVRNETFTDVFQEYNELWQRMIKIS